MNQDKNNSVAIAIMVAGFLIAGGLYLGLQEGGFGSDNSGSGNSSVSKTSNVAGLAASSTPTPPPTSTKDEPFIGNAQAPVTVVEFTDYECPYCQRAFEQIMPQLKKEYVNTGKVKLVLRDLPLQIHEPQATKAAIAANCAKKQGDNKAYFEFHDQYFDQTQGNGQGLPDDKTVTDLAEELGLDTQKFNNCLEDEEIAQEVKQDLQEATSTLARPATPTFVVGKTMPDGTVQGDIIRGAVPYAQIKSAVDKYLE